MAGKVPCPKCGEENYPTDRQCLSCGTALQAAPPPRPAPAAAAPGAAPMAAPVAAAPARKKGGFPTSEGMPKWLYALAVLPIGIPIITLGGAIPGAIGFGLVAANVQIGKNENMPLGARIGLIVLLTGVGYGLVLMLMGAAMKARAGQ